MIVFARIKIKARNKKQNETKELKLLLFTKSFLIHTKGLAV